MNREIKIHLEGLVNRGGRCSGKLAHECHICPVKPKLMGGSCLKNKAFVLAKEALKEDYAEGECESIW